jgi:hypothetical protein
MLVFTKRQSLNKEQSPGYVIARRTFFPGSCLHETESFNPLLPDARIHETRIAEVKEQSPGYVFSRRTSEVKINASWFP